jgi:Icc-related predicted phosphoesterase
MSRLWIFSDLHQDWASNAWDPSAHVPAGGFDVAVDAGDVHSPLPKALDWLADRLPGVPVVYVPGNHDFWWDDGVDHYTVDDVVARGRDTASKHGIHLLLDNAVILDGVRFVGGTLWTDLRLGSWSSGHALNSSRRFMNDYKRIRRRPSGHHKYVRPVDTLALHRATTSFLDAQLSASFPLPSVVVTHHAPHAFSLPDANMDLRWCYASDLGALVDQGQPDLWIHGHIHSRADYRLRKTRIVCNPRGHIEDASAKAFDPSLVIELSRSRGSLPARPA